MLYINRAIISELFTPRFTPKIVVFLNVGVFKCYFTDTLSNNILCSVRRKNIWTRWKSSKRAKKTRKWRERVNSWPLSDNYRNKNIYFFFTFSPNIRSTNTRTGTYFSSRESRAVKSVTIPIIHALISIGHHY